MADLGNLVRLNPLCIEELPAHPMLDSPVQSPDSPERDSSYGSDNVNRETQRPNLRLFVEEILKEATRFVDTILPHSFKSKGLKSAPPSIAKVELLQRMISPADLRQVPWQTGILPRPLSGTKAINQGEAWFARRSRHANFSGEGSADIDEFDTGLRHDHSKHEQEYTPDVYDACKLLEWDTFIREAVGGEAIIGEFRDIYMSIYEMCHKLPSMLSNRVFPVLVLTAKTGQHDFIVVQVPVDIRCVGEAMYSNGRNLMAGNSKIKREKTVIGAYTSIERCRLLPGQNIEWVMATASDAKGWLPIFAQKMGVPGAVVKDVGLFIKWVATKRPFFRTSALGTPVNATPLATAPATPPASRPASPPATRPTSPPATAPATNGVI